MAPMVFHLAAIACVFVSCSAMTPLLDCPPTLNSVFASNDYKTCQQDVDASHRLLWVLTPNNMAAIEQSDACQAALRALHDIEFDACVTSVPTSDSHVNEQISIDKASLDALTNRRLRHVVTRVLQTDGSASFNYNYLYGGIAIFVVVLLVSFVLTCGRASCCCIPIPICC